MQIMESLRNCSGLNKTDKTGQLKVTCDLGLDHFAFKKKKKKSVFSHQGARNRDFPRGPVTTTPYS